MILIFFGPPGAGKGTQASLVAKYFNIPHLSTGDIFRRKILGNDNLSIKLKEILDSGELVSDEFTNDILLDRINDKDCLKGFILDGYPRTIDQSIFLDSVLEKKKLKINKIININIDHNTILERIKLRSNLEERQDDNEEVIKTRITKYITQTKPLSDYYKSYYPSDYHIIKGDQEIEKINEKILFFLKNVNL